MVACACQALAVNFIGSDPGNNIFSDAGNWDAYPEEGSPVFVNVGRDRATSRSNPALVDPSFGVSIGNLTIRSLDGSGTPEYVEIMTGASLATTANVFIGDNAGGNRTGYLTMRSGSSLDGSAGVLQVGSAILSNSGTLLVEDGLSNFDMGYLLVQENGTMEMKFGSSSVSTFVANRTASGQANVIDGLLSVDLAELTMTGSYTLIDSSDSDLLIGGALKTWLDDGGGFRSGTGDFAGDNFSVTNGGDIQWVLTITDGGQDLVLNVASIP